MKSKEFITEGNVRSYNKAVITALMKLGFKVQERETSQGALKTWMETTNSMSFKVLASELSTSFPGTELDDDGMDIEVRGPGFKIEKQEGEPGIFVAVYAGPKAKEYAMGLDEDSVDDDMRDSDRRQARLKAEIEAGMMPTVQNVSGSSDPVYTMGDLEALGWMEKDYTHDSQGEVDGWNRYYDPDAPGAIQVPRGRGMSSEVWQPGHAEDN